MVSALSVVLGWLWFAAAVALTVAVLPGAVYLAVLTAASLLPRRSRAASGVASGGPPLPLTVLIPAHNESELIERCVTSVMASARHVPGTEIVVIADNCSDDTAAIARAAGAHVLERQHETLRGKGYALLHGIDYALGRETNGVLVVDGDSIVSPELVRLSAAELSAGAAATQALYRVDAGAAWRLQLMDLAFLAFNGVRPLGRSGLGASCGIFGNGFALSRKLLAGVPYQAFSITEDLEYHIQVVTAGAAVRFLPDAVVHGHMPSGESASRGQRSRWEGGRLTAARKWIPALSSGLVRGRSEYLDPLLDLATLPLAQLAACALVLLFCPHPVFSAAGALALLTLAAHVLRAALLSNRPLQFLRAGIHVPRYILWKLATLPAIARLATAEAPWVRTDRNG